MDISQAYRDLVDLLPQNVFELDTYGTVTFVNRCALDTFGYTRAEYDKGIRGSHLFIPEDRKRIERSISQVLNSENLEAIELTAIRKNGTTFSVLFYGVTKLQEDEPVGVMALLTDVTEPEQSEQSLASREDYFRHLLENSSDMTVVLDANATMVYISPSLKNLAGYEPHELVGKCAFDFVYPEGIEKAKSLFTEGIQIPGFAASIETRLLRKDGGWRYVEMTGKNLLDEPVINGVVLNFHDIEGQKGAEEELQNKEDYYRILIESSSDMTIVLGADATIVYASPSHKSVAGYEPEELIGRYAFDFVYPEDVERLQALFADGIQTPDYAVSIETRLLFKNGEWRFVDLTGKNLLDEPAINGVVLNFHDIHERKEVEEALRENEEKFRMIFENANDVIIYVDTDGRIINANNKIEDLGYQRDEILGRRFDELEILEPEELQRGMQLHKSGISGDHHDRTEFEVLRKDGTKLYVEVNSKLIEKDDKTFSFISIIRDITKRKQAEAALKQAYDEVEERVKKRTAELSESNKQLQKEIAERERAEEAIRESEEKFRTIFEDANDEIIYIDESGTILDVNKKIESFWGYTREEIIGKNFAEFDLILEESMQEITELFIKAFEDEIPVLAEFYAKRRDGTSILAEVSARVIRLDSGRRAALVILRDATERKQAEEQLRKYATELQNVNEELSHYAYAASHDIGTPLRAIRFNTHLLRKELANISFEDQKGYLNAIDGAVQESLKLAQNLLDLSRLGQRELHIEPIDIGGLLQNVISSAEVPSDVEVVLEENWPTVNSDSFLLTQIFRNLIDNAIKFNTSPQKRIEIRWNDAVKQVYEFSIRDNGIGIDTRHHEDIFKVFKQLHHKEQYQGAGIGLAIVKKATDTLDGSVRVESELGKGSTFFITVPKIKGIS